MDARMWGLLFKSDDNKPWCADAMMSKQQHLRFTVTQLAILQHQFHG